VVDIGFRGGFNTTFGARVLRWCNCLAPTNSGY
jgi:hypothetical protein